jgi:hypothetical protein
MTSIIVNQNYGHNLKKIFEGVKQIMVFGVSFGTACLSESNAQDYRC